VCSKSRQTSGPGVDSERRPDRPNQETTASRDDRKNVVMVWFKKPAGEIMGGRKQAAVEYLPCQRWLRRPSNSVAIADKQNILATAEAANVAEQNTASAEFTGQASGPNGQDEADMTCSPRYGWRGTALYSEPVQRPLPGPKYILHLKIHSFSPRGGPWPSRGSNPGWLDHDFSAPSRHS